MNNTPCIQHLPGNGFEPAQRAAQLSKDIEIIYKSSSDPFQTKYMDHYKNR